MPLFDEVTVRSTFCRVLEQHPEFASVFYERLFARAPRFETYFDGGNMVQHSGMLYRALSAVIDKLDDGPFLAESLEHVGRAHAHLNLQADDFAVFAEVMLETLNELLGPATWTPNAEDSWRGALTMICHHVMRGAARPE